MTVWVATSEPNYYKSSVSIESGLGDELLEQHNRARLALILIQKNHSNTIQDPQLSVFPLTAAVLTVVTELSHVQVQVQGC